MFVLNAISRSLLRSAILLSQIFQLEWNCTFIIIESGRWSRLLVSVFFYHFIFLEEIEMRSRKESGTENREGEKYFSLTLVRVDRVKVNQRIEMMITRGQLIEKDVC